MQKSNYELEILVNGRPVQEYFHEGKTFVEGKKGTKFSLKFKNNSWSRKLFIPTVDGLSAIDGKKASYNSGGYIVPGNSTLTIDGWRVSDEKVAEFYFSHEKDSYGKRKGEGDNLGIIGVAVFEEKPNFKFLPSITPTAPTEWPKWSDNTYNTCSTPGLNINSMNCNYSASSVNSVKQELGTGWGDYKKSEVISVEFDRQDSPAATIKIFYNTKKQLQKMGVEFKSLVYLAPQAFPGEYCEPPQN